MNSNIRDPALMQALGMSLQQSTVNLGEHVVTAAQQFHPLIQQMGVASARGDW